MLRSGLVSVTYRALPPREIINACVEAKLEGIEWGGDVHVPPDNLDNAREVGQMTREAGLDVAAYGSYYRCDGAPFEPILETALALGAPLIRVWAGKTDASQVSEFERARIGNKLAKISEMARASGVQVATEFHGGTLTATGTDARNMLDSVNARTKSQMQSLWQPLRRGANFDVCVEENLAELNAVEPYVSNIHVYEWADDADGKRQRLSLEGSAQWPRYIEKLPLFGGDRWLLLEFVPDDDPAILAREAAALRGFIGSGSGKISV